MTNSSVKEVQQKIFGTGVVESKATQEVERSGSPQTPTASPVGQGTGLTLIIPTPKPVPSPLPRKPTSDQSPKAAIAGSRGETGEEDAVTGAEVEEYGDKEESSVPFRTRLAQKLGPEYEGAERYRLQQDDKKENHWKRWGPYLSDRQWVSLPS